MAVVLPGTTDNNLISESSSQTPYALQSSMTMQGTRRRTKTAICQRFIQNLRRREDIDSDKEGFEDAIRSHFDSLSTRYALDVDIDGIEVLSHIDLLQRAKLSPESVTFIVREIRVLYPKMANPHQYGAHPSQTPEARATLERASAMLIDGLNRRGLRPSFPSSTSLQTLDDLTELMESAEEPVEDVETVEMKEIIVATKDRPQLLSRLTKALADADLNIIEAHAFNTKDGFSFDVFVVDSPTEMTAQDVDTLLRNAFHRALMSQFGEGMMVDDNDGQVQAVGIQRQSGSKNEWEIDLNQVHLLSRIATSSFGQVYKAEYLGQEVAVKIIKDVMENPRLYNEFMQEVSIMKRIRHKNIVQFMGACTAKPGLFLVVEYMENGSVHDYLRKGPLPYADILKIALEVARGMDYLHRCHIIHRDLKTANLLIDKNGTVKIADFGVARVVDNNCCSTAETGTYRWMAPEVIEHKPYNHKADVYSYAITLWELLTGENPYNGYTPIQAAVSVVQQDLRPSIPQHCPIDLAHLIHACWTRKPESRPEFVDIVRMLKGMLDNELQNNEARRAALGGNGRGGILSRLRRSGGSGGC